MLKIKKIKIKDKNQFKIFTIVEGVHGMYAKTAQLCWLACIHNPNEHS